MSSRRFAVAGVIAGVFIFGGIIAAYFYYVFVVPGNQMAREVAQAQARLLAETDHHALLEACRELSLQYVNGQLDINEPLESSPQVPEVIRALRPNDMNIGRDGLVTIEMYTGWWPLGVHAYPEGYPEYPPPFKYGDRELLEGLWYYEDGYSLHPDAYDEIIDKLLGKNQQLKNATSASDPNSEHLRRQTP